MVRDLGTFLSSVLILIMIYNWIRMLRGTFEAAKYGRPGRSYWQTFFRANVFFSRDGYSEAADPARDKAVRGCLGFILCFIAAAIITWITGAGR